MVVELEPRWLLSRLLTWCATRLCSLLDHFAYWAESQPGRDRVGQYKDEVLYNIVPMEAAHILLGRSWQYDCKVIHDKVTNRFTLIHRGGKKKKQRREKKEGRTKHPKGLCIQKDYASKRNVHQKDEFRPKDSLHPKDTLHPKDFERPKKNIKKQKMQEARRDCM
ncbi:hypothetical protein CR513_07636, partial [Mucuna pruriens]